jgi:hypothetical protein
MHVKRRCHSVFLKSDWLNLDWWSYTLDHLKLNIWTQVVRNELDNSKVLHPIETLKMNQYEPECLEIGQEPRASAGIGHVKECWQISWLMLISEEWPFLMGKTDHSYASRCNIPGGHCEQLGSSICHAIQFKKVSQGGARGCLSLYFKSSFQNCNLEQKHEEIWHVSCVIYSGIHSHKR